MNYEHGFGHVLTYICVSEVRCLYVCDLCEIWLESDKVQVFGIKMKINMTKSCYGTV